MKFLIFLLLPMLLLRKCISTNNEAQGSEIDLSFYGSRLYGTPSEEAGKNLEEWYKTHPDGLYAEMQGPYLEGDILVPPPSESRLSVIEKHYFWPGGLVPFVISSNYTAREVNQIRKAIEMFHNKTCVRFIPRTRQRSFVFIFSGYGCYSNIGMVGGRQTVSLQANGCLNVGTIAHELMHSLGFLHEHNREDRDEYVKVHFENIPEDFQSQFDKPPENLTTTYGMPYNYGSVMHYPEYAFGNKLILEPLENTNNDTLGQRLKLSDGDLLEINKMYNCKGIANDLSIISTFNNYIGSFGRKG